MMRCVQLLHLWWSAFRHTACFPTHCGQMPLSVLWGGEENTGNVWHHHRQQQLCGDKKDRLDPRRYVPTLIQSDPGTMSIFHWFNLIVPLTAPIEYQNYYESEVQNETNGSAGFVGGVMKRSVTHIGAFLANDSGKWWQTRIIFQPLAPICRFSNLLQLNSSSSSKISTNEPDVHPTGTIGKSFKEQYNFQNNNDCRSHLSLQNQVWTEGVLSQHWQEQHYKHRKGFYISVIRIIGPVTILGVWCSYLHLHIQNTGFGLMVNIVAIWQEDCGISS